MKLLTVISLALIYSTCKSQSGLDPLMNYVVRTDTSRNNYKIDTAYFYSYSKEDKVGNVERVEADTARDFLLTCDTSSNVIPNVVFKKGFVVTEYQYWSWGYKKNKYYLDDKKRRFKNSILVWERSNIN